MLVLLPRPLHCPRPALLLRRAAILERAWAASTWPEATAAARAGLATAQVPKGAYHASRTAKFDTFAAIIGPHAQGAVLDVGAGGPDLLERLHAQPRIAADILPAARTVPGVEQVVQAHPDALPFPGASFDTIVMTGMAHHLEEGMRARLLDDAHRCLRPAGRLVMLEETFAESSGCGDPRETDMRGFSADFDALSRTERLDFLQFTDWWGNRVMKGSDAIPLPMTCLDIEQWGATLAAARMSLDACVQFGVMSGGGHLATPRALLIATRA